MGYPDAVRPRGDVAGAGGHATWPTGVTRSDVDRWVQTASILHSQRRRLGHRRQGRPDRRRPRAGRGPGEPRPARSQGPVRLAGEQLAGPADPPAGPRDGGDSWRPTGTPRWTAWWPGPGSCSDEQGPSAIGFYTTGQLFLEEYYTLGLIAHGGIGTNHVDGNTRLCTATAAEALKESFGCDGQPGSYTDVDHADVIALYGHNVAETQTVLWMRMLDRLAGPNPPRSCASTRGRRRWRRAATVHLAPRPGTNVALMNALLHEIIANGWVDQDYVEAHAVGFDELEKRGGGLPAGPGRRDLRRARPERSGRRPGSCRHGRAAAVHRAAGLLPVPPGHRRRRAGQQHPHRPRHARPAGLRDAADERPADGAEHPRVRRRRRPARRSATGPTTPTSRIWRASGTSTRCTSRTTRRPRTRCRSCATPRTGSIRLLWVSAHQPGGVAARSCGGSARILAQDRLFLVVQDIFLTETAQLADVVLPAATWGEKTGHVHQRRPHRAPVGEGGRPAGRGAVGPGHLPRLRPPDGLKDKDGEPAGQVDDPEGAFEAWKECTRGRPCDYTGLTYDKLRGGSGIQWPCNDEHPDGTERLYADGRFWAAPGLLRELRPGPRHRRAASSPPSTGR